jgi:hypothetical protein
LKNESFDLKQKKTINFNLIDKIYRLNDENYDKKLESKKNLDTEKSVINNADFPESTRHLTKNKINTKDSKNKIDVKDDNEKTIKIENQEEKNEQIQENLNIINSINSEKNKKSEEKSNGNLNNNFFMRDNNKKLTSNLKVLHKIQRKNVKHMSNKSSKSNRGKNLEKEKKLYHIDYFSILGMFFLSRCWLTLVSFWGSFWEHCLRCLTRTATSDSTQTQL